MRPAIRFSYGSRSWPKLQLLERQVRQGKFGRDLRRLADVALKRAYQRLHARPAGSGPTPSAAERLRWREGRR